MATPPRPKPTDATGVARAKEQKKHEAEIKARANEITTIAASEVAKKDEVLDPKVSAPTVVVDEVISVDTVELADDSVIIRLIAPIEAMTFGQGNNYSFEAGQKYRVPKDLADHLESLGYLYTM